MAAAGDQLLGLREKNSISRMARRGPILTL